MSIEVDVICNLYKFCSYIRFIQYLTIYYRVSSPENALIHLSLSLCVTFTCARWFSVLIFALVRFLGSIFCRKMSCDNDNSSLLIDLNNSDSINLLTPDYDAQASCSQVVNNEPSKGPQNVNCIAWSSMPIYKLLNNSPTAPFDTIENNPFDKLDRRAGLFDDPFEIVENEALTAPIQNDRTVETATLIAIDDNVNDENIGFASDGIVIRNNDTNENDSLRKSTLCKQNDIPRNAGKTRSNSLSLLKLSLSNIRADSTQDTASSVFSVDDNSSGDEYTVSKKTTPKLSQLRTSTTDDSFDDLLATKPNWIDSETDIELESDIDSDIAKLSIPMLNKSINSTNDRCDAESEHGTASKAPNSVAVNRDKLFERLASIKKKIPSPPKNEKQTESADTTAEIVDISICEKQKSPPTAILTPSKNNDSKDDGKNQLVTGNLNDLIEHLKKLINQCEDKQRDSLLESLSTILTLKDKKCSQSSTVHTPPQPIARQGTFCIEKDVDDKNETSMDTISNNSATDETSPTEVTTQPAVDPSLSQVLMDLQSVLGANQNINILQTNIQKIVKSADGNAAQAANPTYIVVMGASTCESINASDLQETPKSEINRTYRSQSLTLKEKPISAVRAAQLKAELLQKEKPVPQTTAYQTPIRKSTVTRRSSFGAVNRPISSSKPSNDQAEIASKAKATTSITRRRSFQGTSSVSGICSPSPKHLFSKPNVPSSSQSQVSSTTSSTAVPKRKSLLSATFGKDSPQKKSGIMKKLAVPPVAQKLKIRVKESLAGRSTAPMRAVVPMSRVAPLLMINESVSPIADKCRKSITTSNPVLKSKSK